MSDPVARRVRAAIEDHGPIGFDEYMEIALYGPGGFFETPPVGADEHFVTSPHVHPFVFAHCVRDALLDAWFALGEPEPLPVVELGAGDGTFAEALSVRVRRAARTATRLHRRRDQHGAHAPRSTHAVRHASALGELDPFDGVVVANEVLDNLPFVPVRGRPEARRRSGSACGARSLVEIEVPWSDDTAPTPATRTRRGDDRAGRRVRAPRDARAGAPDAATSC